MEPNDDTPELEPLEIHIRKSNAKAKFIFYLLMSFVLLWGMVHLFRTDDLWGIALPFFIWVFLASLFAAYEGYLCSFTKGPAFSFSKHGFIDHRRKLPKIYSWEEITSVAWAKRSYHHILQIKLVSPPKIQSYGSFFGYHPYRISSSSIVSSKKRIAGRIKKAVPLGKYRTARNMIK